MNSYAVKSASTLCIHLLLCCGKSLPSKSFVKRHNDTCRSSITPTASNNPTDPDSTLHLHIAAPRTASQRTGLHRSCLFKHRSTHQHKNRSRDRGISRRSFCESPAPGSRTKRARLPRIEDRIPTLDLLPTDNTATPTLAPPAHCGFREKPDASRYHLNLSGTDYIVRLPLESGSSPLQLVPLERPGVFTTLVGLLATPGRSLLQLATYFDREQGDRYRFRLSTERHDGQVEVVAETELSRAAWAIEKSSFRRETWMRLVRDLLIRYSDRAYWHVHEKLKGYRWYLKQIADEDWDWEDAFNSIQFFGKQFSMDARSGWDVGSTEHEWHVHLPCARQQVMTFRQLQTMTAGECLRSRCATCGLLVVKDDNPFRDWLTLHRGRERRARFSAREENWRRLDEEFPLGNRRVSVRTGLLCKALQHAKLSILPPRSASPRSLHMEGCGDALKILEQFSTQLGGMEDDIACTSAELYEELLRKLDRAVGLVEASGHESGNLERLPAGWFALWRLWLIRAAHLVAIPGYDGSRLAALVGEDGPAGDDLAEDDAEMGELEAEMRHAQLEESVRGT